MTKMHHCRLMAMTLLVLGAVCQERPVQAQVTDPRTGAGARQAAAAAVPNACRVELARLCPDIDTATPQGRSAAICLKPFKSSLSLPCRRAVRGVFG